MTITRRKIAKDRKTRKRALGSRFLAICSLSVFTERCPFLRRQSTIPKSSRNTVQNRARGTENSYRHGGPGSRDCSAELAEINAIPTVESAKIDAAMHDQR